MLKIHTAPGGGYIAEMYSIDQSPDAYPVDSITLQRGTVKFALQQFQLGYEGKLSADDRAKRPRNRGNEKMRVPKCGRTWRVWEKVCEELSSVS